MPDWRDAAAYARLLDADRSLLAWEWLRRDPDYRVAYIAHCESSSLSCDALQFGLVAFEPPHLTLPDARPMWRADVHPYVLTAQACGRAATADMFDFESLRQLATIIVDEDGEHLLLSDGVRMVRLDGGGGSLTSAPVRLRYLIDGVAAAEPPLLTLRRFLALCRRGRFSRALHAREARARRWVLMLRAADALAGGAGQRDIAGVLISRSVGEPGWRSREPSIRSQVQRLVRSARQMAHGGWRELLAC